MQDIMKARKKDAAVKPPAQLEPQPGDFVLPPTLYLECGVIKRLKRMPNPSKFPGTLVLRKYRKGEVLCRQGEPGWTAFAILSADDIAALTKAKNDLLEKLPKRIEEHVAKNKHEEREADEKLLALLGAAVLPEPIPPRPDDPAHVVGVYLDTSSGSPRSSGWLARLFGANKSSRRPKKAISVDAPTTIDPKSRRATMGEGSLFGEWSCIYGTPRSATIIAERDCYVLEMLRNVLDSILKDPQFQSDMDRNYRASVLENHLAGLSFFENLSADQLAALRKGIDLKRYKDGEVIFKRGDEPTSMYIVRRGVVKVLVEDAAGESVLTYLSQGDFFGEMGVVQGRPRSATCVAYVHPAPGADEADAQGDKWRKEEQRVELVEIPAALFNDLRAADPALEQKIAAEIKLRESRSRKREAAHGLQDGTAPAQQSDDFQKLGLIQGQKLMLIDLDRCTRCDECVQACISTHSDGRTRLFLDGPRFGQYLVPTTCRSCRDPVCLIGCPVGSIRRGDNLQIVIEDWCIGCQLCAKSCPYGSIQMHDLGLIREQAHGWRFSHASGLEGEGWVGPKFDDRDWMPGVTPFLWDRDMEALVPAGAEPAFAFRHTFPVDAELLKGPEAAFKLSLDSAAREVVVEGKGRSAKLTGLVDVWLNGTKLTPDRWAIQNEQFVFELAGESRSLLHAGKNVLAARATGVPGKRGVLLQAALDEVRPSGAVLPLKAVVCDQCSTLPGQMQACVHACPHDAAKRVDAWSAFPAR